MEADINMWGLALGFGGIGLILLVIGFKMSYRRYVLLFRDGVTTQGRVVEEKMREVDVSSDSDRQSNFVKMYYRVVEFRSAGEKQHRFESGPLSKSAGTYLVGATVSVFYDPGNPANARIWDSTSRRDWYAPLIPLGIFGFLFLVIGIVIVIGMFLAAPAAR